MKKIKSISKILKNLVHIFSRSKSLPPNIILDTERIARSVFSPINVNKKGELKASCFKSPAGIDEVSVNRLDYTTAHFCKKQSKKIQKPENDRTYFGIAILLKFEIINCNANIIFSPILKPISKKNLVHSDIKIGFKPIKGVELPLKYSKIVNDLAASARLYTDEQPNSKKWLGKELN